MKQNIKTKDGKNIEAHETVLILKNRKGQEMAVFQYLNDHGFQVAVKDLVNKKDIDDETIEGFMYPDRPKKAKEIQASVVAVKKEMKPSSFSMTTISLPSEQLLKETTEETKIEPYDIFKRNLVLHIKDWLRILLLYLFIASLNFIKKIFIWSIFKINKITAHQRMVLKSKIMEEENVLELRLQNVWSGVKNKIKNNNRNR